MTKTYEQIIAGLDHCINEVGCDECVYRQGNEGCFPKLMRDALELIQKQQAALERYKKADSFLYAHGWRWDND